MKKRNIGYFKNDAKWLDSFRKLIVLTEEKRILYKQWNYDLYLNGLLGNKPRTWNSYEEIIKSDYGDLICVRRIHGTGEHKVEYNIPLNKIHKIIDMWNDCGIETSQITFNESMPDDCLIIQGELTNFRGPLELCYSRARKPMINGFKEDRRFAEGIKAKMLLKSAMDSSSFADLEVLLETYPTSTIEFSTWSVNVGNIPNRNTVFWEVRNY